MLVLTRKPGEKIRIGEDVILTVLEVRAGTIWLGFSAPEATRIWREEVLSVKGFSDESSNHERT